MRGRSLFLAVFIVLATVLIGAQASFGAGFALYEGSARGNALGGAMVGRADDPSALFFNPAGITQLEGFQVMGGATAIVPDTDVVTNKGTVNQRTTSTEDNVFFPPHVYATYQALDKVWLGFASFSRFGLGTEFPEDWPGRFNNYNAEIQTLSVNPNIALKLNDQLSMAAGIEIMWFDVTLERKIDLTPFGAPGFEVDRSLTGDSFGYGFNAALHYKPLDWLALGASYRSQVKQRVDGKSDYTKPAIVPAPFFNDTDASATIVLPDMVFLGAAFYPTKDFSFEISGVWTQWSTFKKLQVDFENSPTPGIPIGAEPKQWHNVWRVGLGLEYKVTNWLDLRAGYTFDEEPSPDRFVDYLVPANDRHLFSFGPGFHFGNLSLDLSYTYLLIEERDVTRSEATGIFNTLPSKFEDGHAHLIGLSVGYRFF